MSLSVLSQKSLEECKRHATEWKDEKWSCYTDILCCKALTKKCTYKVVETAYAALSSVVNIEETCEQIYESTKSKLCVLPKGHVGKCCCAPHKQMFNNATISCKLDWIYSTPGNNDFVYKNRSDRLFPIVLTDEQEKKVRNKNTKLKCAIPLKDASTPEMLASAYIDYMTLIMNVRGVGKFLNDKSKYLQMLKPVIENHKAYMTTYYKQFNKVVFDKDNHTICPVTGARFAIEDFLLDRDHPNSIQLGHVQPRTDERYTIRGGNILLMSRDGNRIVGDNDFTQEEWLQNIKNILKFHESCVGTSA